MQMDEAQSGRQGINATTGDERQASKVEERERRDEPTQMHAWIESDEQMDKNEGMRWRA